MKPATIFSKLVKAQRLGQHKIWRRGLWYGVAATIEHDPALAGLKVATVLDVGANKGQFALFARVTWPEAKVIAFEPMAGAAGRFRRLFATDPNVSLIQAALGPEDGETTIHVSRRADSSSLLPIGPGQRSRFPGTDEVRQETVKVGRLQSLLDTDEIIRPVLLKLDVQGFELSALMGAEELLERIDYIYCECSYVELYQGQALAADVISYLNGFGLHEAGCFNAVHDSDKTLVQADLLFARR